MIAKLAGISTPMVYRKLAEGRTPSEIIAASQLRREQQVLRHLPAVKVDGDGHPADGAMPSFAAAQAERERWSARLKKLEYQKSSAEVIPVSYVRTWGSQFLTGARDTLMAGPSELQDQLAFETDPAKCRALLERWLETVMAKLHRTEKLWGGGAESMEKSEVA
jgi:hypothetical protein